MNLAVFQSTLNAKLNFQFQHIVGESVNGKDTWLEMFYRPQCAQGFGNVENFFRSLTAQQKVDLDYNIFNELPTVLAKENPKRLSINLMPISLLCHDFRSNLMSMIKNQLIDCNHICIEIVETQSMPSLSSSAIELLQYFRSQGGWIALDDFGSGFAHWELLQLGLIDVIKVANQNLNQNNTTESFTHGLAKFAASMSINTVLEGIETKKDLDLGLSQGFKNFQGWYFNDSHPIY